jgi:ubiquitin C-terminal hydrolase
MRRVTPHYLIFWSTILSVLSDSEAVFCGNCNRKTTQTSSRECSADTLLIEIMRVTGHGGGSRSWSKNSIPISFPTQNLKLSSRSYRVAASCHHRGSIKSGHWTTKVCTSTGTWYELDDLKGKPSVTNPPGTLDSSVTVLLLIAENRLII